MNDDHIQVLLAEDNPSDAELFLASLQRDKLADRIHVVHDGEEALAFLFGRDTDEGAKPTRGLRLVVLDVKLPKVDGLEVLREIKSNGATRHLPVVMLTSSNVERDVALAYRLGANSYVQKPVDFEQFRATMRQLGLYWLTMNEPPPRALGLDATG